MPVYFVPLCIPPGRFRHVLKYSSGRVATTMPAPVEAMVNMFPSLDFIQCLLLLLLVQLDLGEIKVLAGRSFVDVQHVHTSGFEVRCRVVACRDKDLTLETVVGRFHVVGHLQKLLLDWSEQIQSWFDLYLGVVGLDGC